MRVPLRVLKLVVGVPAVLVSTLLWAMVLAVLPSPFGAVGFLCGVALLVMLTAGAGERVAVAALAGARPLSRAERAAIGPLAERLAGLEVAGGREWVVRRSVGLRTPPAQLIGRTSLLVTPWLIDAAYRGWLTVEEAAALVVHAEGRWRCERPRAELAMLVLTLPWRAAGAVAVGLGQAAGWFPLVRFAWAVRGVVGVVAVVQQVGEGRAPLGVLAGIIVAMTYLVPAAGRAKAVRVEEIADQAVVRRGFGVILARLLPRYRLPVSPSRLRRLQAGHPPAGQAPGPGPARLRLVRSS